MAQQIIITKDNYGIEVSVGFVDDRKRPIDITGLSVEVVISNPTNVIIDTISANITQPTLGKASIVLDTKHTSDLGLYKSFWSCTDENGFFTAQEDIYYFVKDKNGGSDVTEDDMIFNPDRVIAEFGEIDERLDSLEEQVQELSEINVNAEIIEARGGENTLDVRLDKLDISLSSKATNIDIERIDLSLDNITNLGYENTQLDTLKKRFEIEKVNILDFGAGNGDVVKDTQAFKYAISVAKRIYVPSGVRFLINETLTLQQNQTIEGDYSFNHNDWITNTCINYVGEGVLFDLINKSCTIKNLRLFGNNLKGIAIKNAYNSRVLYCDISNFASALESVKGSTQVIGCEICRNNYGLNHSVDSRYMSVNFHANYLFNVYCVDGSNDNHFVNCKMDWSEGINIFLARSENATISSCVIDRATSNGLKMVNMIDCTITGNVFRRNYLDLSNNKTNCQIYLENCNNIAIVSNICKPSAIDDNVGTTDIAPSNSLHMYACDGISLIGNTLKGRDMNGFSQTSCTNTYSRNVSDVVATTTNPVYTGDCVNGQYCYTTNDVKSIFASANSKIDMVAGTKYTLLTDLNMISKNIRLTEVSHILPITSTGNLGRIRINNTTGVITLECIGTTITTGTLINFIFTYI